MGVTHVRIFTKVMGIQIQLKDVHLRADSPLETTMVRNFRAMSDLLANSWQPTGWLILWQGDGKIAIVEDGESVWH